MCGSNTEGKPQYELNELFTDADLREALARLLELDDTEPPLEVTSRAEFLEKLEKQCARTPTTTTLTKANSPNETPDDRTRLVAHPVGSFMAVGDGPKSYPTGSCVRRRKGGVDGG